MHAHVRQAETTVLRRVFPSWSISIPSSFRETFVAEDGYWHAHDTRRSVSLSSIVLTDRGAPVSAQQIERRLPPLEGIEVSELPPGTRGQAAVAPAIRPARASRALSGILVADGRSLVVTITSDDLEWARATWLSIRHHPDAEQGSDVGPARTAH